MEVLGRKPCGATKGSFLLSLNTFQVEAKSLSLAQCSEGPGAPRDTLFTPTPGT